MGAELDGGEGAAPWWPCVCECSGPGADGGIGSPGVAVARAGDSGAVGLAGSLAALGARVPSAHAARVAAAPNATAVHQIGRLITLSLWRRREERGEGADVNGHGARGPPELECGG